MNRKAAGEFQQRFGDLMKWLYIETNPIAVKAALNMMGVIDSRELRLPMTELDPKFNKDLKACLKNLSLV
jgi:4-hydroxy-tetrahydrodipicolinate synthase